jgi:hypothetical protein
MMRIVQANTSSSYKNIFNLLAGIQSLSQREEHQVYGEASSLARSFEPIAELPCLPINYVCLLLYGLGDFAKIRLSSHHFPVASHIPWLFYPITFGKR